MMATHVLRTDGSTSLGLGHVARCLTIAEAIRAQGGLPEIALGHSDRQVCRRIEETGIPFRRLRPKEMFEPQHIVGGSKIAIFDFSHRATRSQLEEAAHIFTNLNQRGVSSLLIDGKGQECLSALSPMMVDTLVIPYSGAEKQKVFPGAKVDVRGPRYMILDDSFLKKRVTTYTPPPIAEKILVTAGGSDPKNLTLFFLKVLGKVTVPIRIRAVVGPSFSPNLIEAISSMAQVLPHPITLVQAPETLANEICEADLALSASGLTKYELAFSGTPSVLISIDASHANDNLPFSKIGACHDAGLLSMANVDTVANVVEELILDRDRRCNLAAAGIAAIDGRGTNRLMDLING